MKFCLAQITSGSNTINNEVVVVVGVVGVEGENFYLNESVFFTLVTTELVELTLHCEKLQS